VGLTDLISLFVGETMPYRFVTIIALCCAVIASLGAAWWYYQQFAANTQLEPGEQATAPQVAPSGVATLVRLSPQARQNLQLVSKPLELTTYWRTVEFPGVIVDRPGVSDRGVVAPVAGVVTEIHVAPGDAVEPGTELFSIRLVSESLHKSQLELFQATKDTEIEQRKLERLSTLAKSGIIPGSRIIEIENEMERLGATVQAYRQDLAARGLPADRIDAAARGEFLTELIVQAPAANATRQTEGELLAKIPFAFEVQSLAVELGQQVSAGEVLCHLADHRELLIEGRAFKDDVPLIQRAALNDWKVAVEVDLSDDDGWPPLPVDLPIEHLANSIDPQTRTFGFYLALTNQWKAYSRDGTTRLLWRFRPGSRVRLRVPVEKLENVLVVPQQAVVREGPEAFVFRQNGEMFDRRPVRVLHEDRLYAVLANDGSVRPGFHIAQNSAASLNRVLKAQAASGAPANVHVHADGTVHEAH